MKFQNLTPLWVILSIGLLITPSLHAATTEKTRPVIGWVEYVGLGDTKIVAKGRIDSRAGLASIDASIIEIRRQGSHENVVFRIDDGNGGKVTLEREVMEWVNIKKKGSNGVSKRPVVEMLFCVGGKKIRARTNLADRGGFLYPILIGRNVLQTGQFMIDPTEKFMHPASACTQ